MINPTLEKLARKPVVINAINPEGKEVTATYAGELLDEEGQRHIFKLDDREGVFVTLGKQMVLKRWILEGGYTIEFIRKYHGRGIEA